MLDKMTERLDFQSKALVLRASQPWRAAVPGEICINPI